MKDKLLLHTCCCPCLIGIIEELTERFDISVFYYNPNIYPKEEYEKRKTEAEKICNESNIQFIEGKYEPEEWIALTREYVQEPEGGKRCPICFRMRLEQTAKYAKENGYQYFASTLTSGRNKKADVINPLGEEIGKNYKILFLAEDWKKKGRQEKGKHLCDQKQVYRQHYCGCVYSIQN